MVEKIIKEINRNFKKACLILFISSPAYSITLPGQYKTTIQDIRIVAVSTANPTCSTCSYNTATLDTRVLGLILSTSVAYVNAANIFTATQTMPGIILTSSGGVKFTDGTILYSTANITAGGATPIGSAGGDLSGTYPNPTIGSSKVTDSKTNLSTAAIASGLFGDNRVGISTGGVISGKFDDNRVAISTGATSGIFGDDKLAISTAGVTSGKFGDNRVAITTGAISGTFGDDKISISTGAISSGKFGDSRVSISTAGVVGTFNDTRVLLTTGAITSGKFGDDRVSFSTSALQASNKWQPAVLPSTIAYIDAANTFTATQTINATNATGYSLSVSSGINAQCILLQNGQVCGPSAGGGGGGTPGGSDTQVQFNNGGAFGGSANLTWNGSQFKTTYNITAASGVFTSTVNFGGVGDAVSTFTSTGKLYMGSVFASSVVWLTDGATPALDASLGNQFNIIAAGNRTIAIPSNPRDGQKIIIRHTASGADRTLSLNTGAGGFRFGKSINGLKATTSNKTDYIGAIYNATDNFWDVISYVQKY